VTEVEKELPVLSYDEHYGYIKHVHPPPPAGDIKHGIIVAVSIEQKSS
jgi:phospholipase C